MERWYRPARAGTASRRRPHLLLAIGMVASLVLCSCGLLPGQGSATSSAPSPTSPYNKFLSEEESAFHRALSSVHVAVPTKAGAPAPGLSPGAFGSGLGSHTVLGFLPSWEVGDASSLDYAALSEVSYYAAQVEPGGKLLESGAGWEPLVDGEADGLVSDAHAAGDRVLLTLFSQTQSTLGQIASDPAADGSALAGTVAPLLAAHHFDGVDLDLEGEEGADRGGFVKFVAAFSEHLRALGSGWSIVLNSFPQAAVDPSSFFDVKALAPYVDDFFIMAYDMGDTSSPGPTAPLVGENLSDASAIASYEAVVPASKLILGIPFYGYDFTASRGKLPAVTIGSPYAVTYASVASAERPALWDPSSETPYSSFKRAGQWHQTWFDDPTSVALKVALASAFHTAGVGAWDLGMAAGQPSMVTALDGGDAPARQGLAGGA